MTDPTHLLRDLRARVVQLEAVVNATAALQLSGEAPEPGGFDAADIKDFIAGWDCAVATARKAVA